MIGLRLDALKTRFFDRAAVYAATTAAERRVLSRFGAFVRQRARSSIRTRKGTSPPGQPPFSHTGLLRRNLFFAYDSTQRGVVIGAVRLNQSDGTAPELLEHGGSVLRRRGGRSRRLTYAARPYMQPAFDRELTALPPLWRDSIR